MSLFGGSPKGRRKKKSQVKCDRCGRRLRDGHWITGRDLRVTDGKRKPRYCWPGEGCLK